MRIPNATYRLQFHSKFDFKAARKIVPYLYELGISDLYASPIFAARPGSTHGYDVIDPNRLNPELGTSAQFDELTALLQQKQMGWLQDIVPNHMAFDSQNHFLMEILAAGPEAQDYNFFDVDWNHHAASLKGKVLAPLLGSPYSESLEKGDIKLVYGETGLKVRYFDLRLPVRIESYRYLLMQDLDQLSESLGSSHPDFVRLRNLISQLNTIAAETNQERCNQRHVIKVLLWELYTQNKTIQNWLDSNVAFLNGETADSSDLDTLDSILSEQYYRLSSWKVGAEEINYRRFFTVNELISVRVEEPEVFNKTHVLIRDMVAAGKFTGLRVDHIDGLYDPAQYLNRLQETAPDTYITVEKILERQEELPMDWTLEGTSGYDFLNAVNGIFCQIENEQKFSEIYIQFTHEDTPYETLAEQKKTHIIERNLAGDVENLARRLQRISAHTTAGRDFTARGLCQALSAVLAQFPVYRTYTASQQVRAADGEYIEQAVAAASKQLPHSHRELAYLKKLLLFKEENLSSEQIAERLHFVMKFQQLTGPLMAKGIEDTLLYVYSRLVSLNEVGGDPGHFGNSLEEFHQFNQHRSEQWPHAQNATATHDTKRGEDMRARLNVISELPELWQEQVNHWKTINQAQKVEVGGSLVPTDNDEYFLYQTLVGAAPFGEMEPDFSERIRQYALKSIREAKVHTTWLHSNGDYESAYLQFIDSILADPQSDFFQAFYPFQQRVAAYGIYNSLSQVLLKFAAPGVPDLYQGDELWDLSLVDPDNRRPVDYEQRIKILQALRDRAIDAALPLIQELLANRTDGSIKLFLTTQMLQARKAYPELFRNGSYLPLNVQGKHANSTVAFARQYQNTVVIAAAPRFLTTLVQPNALPLGDLWQDTHIELPPEWGTDWKNLVTGVSLTQSKLNLSEVFQHFPGALLISQGGQPEGISA